MPVRDDLPGGYLPEQIFNERHVDAVLHFVATRPESALYELKECLAFVDVFLLLHFVVKGAGNAFKPTVRILFFCRGLPPIFRLCPKTVLQLNYPEGIHFQGVGPWILKPLATCSNKLPN